MSSQSIQKKSKNIVIVAGEVSGDTHAARLVKELKKFDDSICFRGMGGDSLRQQGVNIFIDMSALSVVGFVEVLFKYRMIKAELEKLKQNIKKQPPDLLILVDYQEFNQQLAAYAKSIGIKVLFYIGPQVWAWRPNRVYKMAKIVDHMAVILPFEKALYDNANVPVTFTGHPLTDEVKKDKSQQQARALLNIKNITTVGLFPGSRSGEIAKILPILLASAKLIQQQLWHKNTTVVQFILPVANTIKDDELIPYKAALKELSVDLVDNKFYDVAQSCDIILTASGTATLEIGLLEIPMVIVYKTSAITFFIGKNLVSLKHIGLVNIIPGKEIVREFLQGDAKPQLIADEALHLLNDKDYYQSMQRELATLRQQLGDGNGSKNVAELAWKMLNNTT